MPPAAATGAAKRLRLSIKHPPAFSSCPLSLDYRPRSSSQQQAGHSFCPASSVDQSNASCKYSDPPLPRSSQLNEGIQMNKSPQPVYGEGDNTGSGISISGSHINLRASQEARDSCNGEERLSAIDPEVDSGLSLSCKNGNQLHHLAGLGKSADHVDEPLQNLEGDRRGLPPEFVPANQLASFCAKLKAPVEDCNTLEMLTENEKGSKASCSLELTETLGVAMRREYACLDHHLSIDTNEAGGSSGGSAATNEAILDVTIPSSDEKEVEAEIHQLERYASRSASLFPSTDQGLSSICEDLIDIDPPMLQHDPGGNPEPASMLNSDPVLLQAPEEDAAEQRPSISLQREAEPTELAAVVIETGLGNSSVQVTSTNASDPTYHISLNIGRSLGNESHRLASVNTSQPLDVPEDENTRKDFKEDQSVGDPVLNVEEDAGIADADATSCPICMEPWTGVGAHRICSLACGHLFGRSCIRRWLRQAGKKQGKCPHCNRRASVNDIRTLYVPRIAVAEGGQNLAEELGKLQAKNQELSAQNNKLLDEVHRLQAFLDLLCPEQFEALNGFQVREGQHNLFEEFRHLQPVLNSRDILKKRHRSTVHHDLGSSSKELQGFQYLSQPFAYDRNTDSQQHGVSFSMHTLNQDHNSRHTPLTQGRYDALLRSGIYINDQDIEVREAASSKAQIDGSQGSTQIAGIGFHRGLRAVGRPVGAGSSSSSILLRQNGDNGLQSCFQLQDEVVLTGAKVFDMDASCQLLLISQKASDLGNNFRLHKRSLLALSEGECINLPPSTGVVRDLRIAPPSGRSSGRLALVASLGRKLSVISLESNNVVLTYNLQSPLWSCAWDPNEPNYVYGGSQNGGVLVFDLRQTIVPLNSVKGLSNFPVHTLHPVPDHIVKQGLKQSNIGGSGAVSASSGGLCFWDTSISGSCRPCNLPTLHNQGVCVSLAYSDKVDMAVATFRPKLASHEYSSSFTAAGVESQSCDATHVPARRKPKSQLLSRTEADHMFGGCNTGLNGSENSGEVEWSWEQERAMTGCISRVGMSRSAIVCGWRPDYLSDCKNLFASGDEGNNALCLWDIETSSRMCSLKPHQTPILDVKSINVADRIILGCTSERMLQIFRH